ncbi:MAG: energy transducer TonB [Gammaproteobacteria bacterium]
MVLLVACSAPGQAQQDWSPDEGVIDPRDTWTCVLYGNPALGDERVLLSFAPDQSTLMAKPSVDDARPWAPLSRWQVEDEILSFRDSRTGRDFQANLRRSTLGGEWRALNLLGGWWCSEAREEVDLGIFAAAEDESRAMLVPLIPAVMATPAYPRQAIREAIEGRVVLCFEVDPTGEVRDPEFVELSDEIFRASSLDALMSSKYQPWLDRVNAAPRPGCRSFVFQLDRIF